MIKKLILHVLRERGPLHIYGIIKSIEEETLSMYRPSTGVIYPALNSLISEGLVKMQILNGDKIYSITEKGEAAISLDTPFKEHIRKLIGKNIPYKELFETFKLIVKRWDNLSQSQKDKINQIIREFSIRIREVIED